MRAIGTIVGVLLMGATMSEAAVVTKTLDYDYDGTKFKGFLAYDDAIQGPRPGVLVVHEWWGLNEYARQRARMLAELGYTAFAVDMYGEGKTAAHPNDAAAMAGKVRENEKVWLGRAKAGLEVLKSQPQTDPKRLAAIGYCFGGQTALKLGFSGADLAAVVSFHGALPVPTDEQVAGLKAKLLICHGALDSFIPQEVINQFRQALDAGKARYKFIAYEGAYHSFTVPEADKAGVKGLAYNKQADEQSWAEMKALFQEVFATRP